MIAIVDYGVGNLFSLKSSFDAIGAETVVTAEPNVLSAADGIVLPGVGAFCDAREKLRQGGLDALLCRLAKEGRPLLGICLGMQLLFESSREYGVYEGLGLLHGEIAPISEQIPSGLKIPHMGWNELMLQTPSHPLFQHITAGECVYFVHSYAAVGCGDSRIATAEYGVPLTAAVACGNVMGCQFHPEKSGETGLRILRAFCEICEKGGNAE